MPCREKETAKDFRLSWCGALVLSCLVLSCLVVSCLVVSCLVLSCLVVSCRVVSCRVVSCRVVSCLVLCCRALPCLVVSGLALSCLVVSCLVLPCLAVPCRVVSCRVMCPALLIGVVEFSCCFRLFSSSSLTRRAPFSRRGAMAKQGGLHQMYACCERRHCDGAMPSRRRPTPVFSRVCNLRVSRKGDAKLNSEIQSVASIPRNNR